jgi:hypothetical protein
VGTQESGPVKNEVPLEHVAPAYYARGRSGWRAWWTLLHPPYTLMHLSFVVLGAGLAPELNMRSLAATALSFFLALGIASHALDELAGRPLGTDIPKSTLMIAAALGLGFAVAIGFVGVVINNTNLLWFILLGVSLAISYNLSRFERLSHTDLWFGLAWGAFPVLTSHFAQTGYISYVSVLGAGYALAMAVVQRLLSTPARRLRRKVDTVNGQIRFRDGQIILINRTLLLDPLERVLHYLVLISVLSALTVLATHFVSASWFWGF